ncbi:hypothetical protein ACEPAI_3249 [Sanghuangporus weigelae]
MKVDSTRIKDPLKEGSLVPVQNAFSVLAPYGFNYHAIFAPDLMHEFELGVWKAIFEQLIRILRAQGGDAVPVLDNRYRMVPTFGYSTIRRFPVSASAMKKLAARDFEDMLQCALPVFEEIVTKKRINKIILDLLFILSFWHAIAKLRLHVETTVRVLEYITRKLGFQVRLFKKETSIYNTRELPKEVAARGRRKAAIVKMSTQTQKKSTKLTDSAETKPKPKPKPKPKRKELSINTPKFHALGGYAHYIRLMGSTDNYTTQNGESQHKRVKRFYARTNKQNAAKFVSKLEERTRKLQGINRRIARARGFTQSTSADTSEQLPKSIPDVHYQMANSMKDFVYISVWIGENRRDPALKNFWKNLHSHLLARVLLRDEDDEFSSEEIDGLQFRLDKLYWHKVIRVNYTAYDVRREQDSLNPRSHPNITLLSSDSDMPHPYLYARILGLFHVDIAYHGPGSISHSFRRMDVAWIHWYQYVSDQPFRFLQMRLPELQLLHYKDPNAFGFINPDLIIRGAHIIPRFSHGYSKDPLLPFPSRPSSFDHKQYKLYYVNIFVDRDMILRYLGGGIGHKGTWHGNDNILAEILVELAELNEEDAENEQNVEDEEIDDQDGTDTENEDEDDCEDEGGSEEDEKSDSYADL